MQKPISRRSFLKASAAAAGATAVAAAPGKALVRGSVTGSGEELATLLDLRKCVACGECVEACRKTNGHKFPQPKKPFPTMVPTGRVPVSDWSNRRQVDGRLTPYNWLFIETASGKHQGKDFEINVPRRCMHCQKPPCVNLCPFGAADKQQNGIVRIDADVCIGGAKCKQVCPWHVPQRQTGVGLYLDLLPNLAGNGVMYKCDRCFDRVAKGKLPACIEVCPEKVQKIGPRSRMVAEAYRLAKKIGGYVYGDQENGGTNTIYVSPVPFSEISSAIAQQNRTRLKKRLGRAVHRGRPEASKLARELSALKSERDWAAMDPKIGARMGRPLMQPEADRMAKANNLAYALLIAPFAGAAAAIGKFYKWGKNQSPVTDADTVKPGKEAKDV